MPKPTLEQLVRRRQRSEREATFPRCKQCGNVLGVERATAGIKRCRGCLPDEQLETHDRLCRARLVTLPNVADPYAREALGELIDIVNGLVGRN